MNDATTEVKLRARLLKRAIDRKEPRALERLASLRAVNRPQAGEVKHKHCLDLVAQEFGFANFSQAREVFAGETLASDFGTLLEVNASSGLLNHWFANYEEAREFHEANGGYLLGYRRQSVVVKRPYIEALGLDPEDDDWVAMGFDWVRPRSVEARSRFYAKLLANLPKEGGA